MADAARIDAAILADTDPVFRKVARIIYMATKSLRGDGVIRDGIAEATLIGRVKALVAEGRLDGVGDLDDPTRSEIRLPQP